MAKSMSKRQRQVAELIRRNLSMVLQQEGQYIYDNALVTVTNVVVSPDLQLAKVYLSVYNTENKQGVILMVQESKHRLQQSLVQRVRKQIRRVPSIDYYLDDTLDEMYRVTELFDRLETENQMGTSEKEGDIEE